LLLFKWRSPNPKSSTTFIFLKNTHSITSLLIPDKILYTALTVYPADSAITPKFTVISFSLSIAYGISFRFSWFKIISNMVFGPPQYAKPFYSALMTDYFVKVPKYRLSTIKSLSTCIAMYLTKACQIFIPLIILIFLSFLINWESMLFIYILSLISF